MRILTCMSFTLSVTTAIEAGDLDEDFDRHAAAVARIDRVHFDFVSVGHWYALSGPIRGEFWCAGGVKRTDYTTAKHSGHARLVNGIMTFVGKNELGSSAGVSAWGPFNGLEVMPRHELLLELDSSLQGIGSASLRQVVTAPNADAQVSRAGNLVTFKLFKGAAHFVIDLSKNGLVCERSFNRYSPDVPYDPNKDVRRVERVTSFRELTPGVYFPEATEWDEYAPRGGHHHRTFRASNITLMKLEATVPELDLTGLNVIDSVAGKEYTVAADGTKSGEKDFVPAMVGPSSPALDQPARSTEPPRAFSWLLPSGIALVVVALGLWAFGRHRGRREPTID